MSDYTRPSVRASTFVGLSAPISFSPFNAANGVILKDDILRTAITTGLTLSALYFADDIWHRRVANGTKLMIPLPRFANSTPPLYPMVSPSGCPIASASFGDLSHNSTTCLWPLASVHRGAPKHRSIKWLDYPADRVLPKMDLFSDDPVPFTFSSRLFCPFDSEHLEKAYETLKYQHAVKTLGVPSVANNGVRILTCASGSSSLGGTSRWDDDPFLGGFGSLSLLPFEQGSDGDDSGQPETPSSGNDEGSGDDEGSDYGYGGDIDDETSETRSEDCLPYIYGTFDSAPPPPPPPPSGVADPEDDDGDFSSLFIWSSLVCGCFSGLLLKLYLSLKKRKLGASLAAEPELMATGHGSESNTFKQRSNTTLSVPIGPTPVVVGILQDPAEATDMASLLDSYCLLQFNSNSTDVCKPVSDDLDMATAPLSVSWLQASKLVVEAFFGKLPRFGIKFVKIVVVFLVFFLCLSLQIVIFGFTGRVRRRGFFSLLKRIFCWKLPRRTPETATTVDNCEGTRDDGSVEAVEASASVANIKPEMVVATKPVVEDDLERQFRILDTLSNYTLSGSIWASQAPIVPARPYNIPDDLATKNGDNDVVQSSVSVPQPPPTTTTAAAAAAATTTTPSKSSKKARRRRARRCASQDQSSGQNTEKDSMSDASSGVPDWANA